MKKQERLSSWINQVPPDSIAASISLDVVYKAYRLNAARCRTTCPRNQKGNPWCVHGLGQKVWEKVINADQEPNDWQIRPRKSGIYVGLRNLGATCYVNAFIQLWFHNTALRRALYSWCPQSVKRQRIDNNGNWGLTMEKNEEIVQNLQRLFCKLEHSAHAVIDPAPFVESLGLSTSEQQDASEFNKLFMSILEHELRAVGINVIQELMEGEGVYVVECQRCLTRSCHASTFSELQLPVEGNQTFGERLAALSSRELLSGDNAYNCASCQCKQNAIRWFQITKLPRVLNVQLLRFVFDQKTSRRRKDNSYVQFPAELPLTWLGNYMGPSYRLQAVLNHCGNDAHSGHYVAHICTGTQNGMGGTWTRFNDDSCEPLAKLRLNDLDKIRGEKKPKCNGTDYCSQSAYMLVYTQSYDQPTQGGETDPLTSLAQSILGPSSLPVQSGTAPPHLIAEVMSENNEFCSLLTLVQQQNEEAQANQLNYHKRMRGLCKALEVPNEGQFICVATDKLKRWIESGKHIAKDSALLTCKHGQLSLDKMDTVKFINADLENHLFEKGDVTRLLTQDNLCTACIKAIADDHYFVLGVKQDAEHIQHLQYQESETGWWLDKSAVKNFRKLATQSRLVEDKSIILFNATVRCPHGKLEPDETKRKLVSTSLISIFTKYFSNIPIFPYDTHICEDCHNTLLREQQQNNTLQEHKKTLSRLNILTGGLPYIKNITTNIIPLDFCKRLNQFLTYKNVGPKPVLNNEGLLCVHKKLPVNLMDPYEEFVAFVKMNEWKIINENFGPADEITCVTDDNEVDVYTPDKCNECIRPSLIVEYNLESIYVRKVDLDEPPDPGEGYVSQTGRNRVKRGDKIIKGSSHETLFDLKVKICRKFAVAPAEQLLILQNGRELKGDNDTLAVLGVKAGAVLSLLCNDSHSHDEESTTGVGSTDQEYGFKGTALSGGYQHYEMGQSSLNML